VFRSRARAAAVLAAGAYGVRRWVAAADADPQAVRRKIAVATWSAPREGRLMTRLVVDADPVLEYVTAGRTDGADGLTAMHVVGAAAARALLAVPAGNARVLGGRVLPHADVSVAFAVDIGRGSDLAPVKVPAADTLTPGEIATAVWRGVRALRAGTDAGFRTSGRVAAAVPVPLMRPLTSVASVVLGGLGWPLFGQQGHPLGSVFVSNVAPLGIEEVFLAPVPFARAAVYLAMGTVTERPVVRDGSVVPVRQMTLSMTGDHRIIDGVQAGIYLAELRRLLADPGVLDRPA
jgi:pyruvate/2-oxoglutarate dehydrogenase complex dihydrolipoamide acyltransferase (E2) component